MSVRPRWIYSMRDSFYRIATPGNVAKAKDWIPSLAKLGVAAGIAGLMVTEWPAVLRYVPYVGGRYKDDD